MNTSFNRNLPVKLLQGQGKRTTQISFDYWKVASCPVPTLGRERGAMAALPEAAGRERGDDEAGLAVMSVWIERAGISTGRLALHDGSGLSRLDLVTPEANARFLLAPTSKGQPLVFSIVCNVQTGSADSSQLIDQIITLLASYPNLPAVKTQKSE